MKLRDQEHRQVGSADRRQPDGAGGNVPVVTTAELSGQVAHLRNALDVLYRAAARDWLDGVKSDDGLDALEFARRTLNATTRPTQED